VTISSSVLNLQSIWRNHRTDNPV